MGNIFTSLFDTRLKVVMANIKRIEIVGEIPFNVDEHHDMCQMLGQMNAPSCGVRIAYTGNAPSRPNEYGGKTAYYNFCISGEEAVSDKWIDHLLKSLVNCGASVSKAQSMDIENETRMMNHKIPTT